MIGRDGICRQTPREQRDRHTTQKNQRKEKKNWRSPARGYMPGPGRVVRRKRRSSAEESAHLRIVASLRFTLRSTTSDEFVALCAGDERPFKTGRGQETRAPGPRGRDLATWTSGRLRLDPVHVAVFHWATPADLTWCARGGGSLPSDGEICVLGGLGSRVRLECWTRGAARLVGGRVTHVDVLESSKRACL